jgi:outer membrane protein TolC
MLWSKAAGAGLAMSLCACASAQISLASAVDLALRNSPKVREAQANVDKARAALAQAHDAYIPNITADGGYGQGVGPPSGLPTVFSLSSQSLLFNFSQQDNVRAAASGLQSATLSVAETRNQITEDVAITYLDLDNAQQRQAAMNQEYEIATHLVGIVQDRLAAGQDTQMESLRAQRTVLLIRQERRHTENEIATLSDHLSRLIGLPGNPLTAISASIPAMPAVGTLTNSGPDSFGIQAAFASAKSKQEIAFGESRYRFRPQLSLGANYSYLDTSEHDFLTYYPTFKGKSSNDASIYIQLQFPIFDKGHDDHAREAEAEARRARFEAEDQRNQFLEGRLKLRRSLDELSDSYALAEIDREIAQQQLDAVLVQLNASAGDPNKPQMTPKDEQNARLQERQKFIDLLDTQAQLSRAQINLLRQTGQLDSWLKTAASQSSGATITASPR